jgi:hypothetical protein
MEVRHPTPLASSLDSALDAQGNEVRIATLKATFNLVNGRLFIADDQEPVAMGDTYAGAVGLSSVAYESDLALHKPGTDVVVTGTVYSPQGKFVPRLVASVGVGSVVHEILVTGDRRWQWGGLGIRASDPAPFREMPIGWERSYGGGVSGRDESGSYAGEERNPVGTGFIETKSRGEVEGLALPNFEDPREPIRQWNDRPAPRGFGFVGRSWLPRRRYAGTYDDNWARQRSPLLPRDFDDRFFQAAPAPMAMATHLEGGEAILLRHLTPRDAEAFSAPPWRVWFSGYAKGAPFKAKAKLDTLVIQTDRMRVLVVWRHCFKVDLDEPGDVVRAQVDGI